MIEEVLRKMNPKDVLKENFYRYSHELNKINFLMKIAKRLITYLLQKEFKFNSKYILVATIMLVKLARIESQTRFKILLMRENALNQLNFQHFCESK